MSSIGVQALAQLLQKSASVALITGAAFGLASGLVLVRAPTLVTIRRFLLSLITWFLPLTLAFAIVWVAALAVTGVQPLFATRNAAFYLLWFNLLGIVFVNAAYQNGQEPPAYPPRLARALGLAWWVMPVLAALACWALVQRIVQHGWTDDRIWASLVTVLVSLHVLLYALSSASGGGRPWMRTIAPANIAIALFQVLAIAALISPIADARRLGVQAQVGRLLAGAVAPEAFDWDYLLRDGRYGRAALARLAAYRGDEPASRRIAALAEQTLARATARSPVEVPQPAAAPALTTVLPQGAVLTDDMKAWLASQKPSEAAACPAAAGGCLLWINDFDGVGVPDVGVIVQQLGGTYLTLFARTDGAWKARATSLRHTQSLAEWRQAIETGSVTAVPPRWPDLMIGGDRLRLDER